MKRLFGGKKSSAHASPVDDQAQSFEPLPTGNAQLEHGQAEQPQQQHEQQQQYGHGPPTGHQQQPVMAPMMAMGPPRVSDVVNAIGWSCAAPAFDYAYVLSLADHLSSSSAAAKDAAKALRKEFKHAVPEAQERAVRLTGILMRNTDLRFREQVASKKFLTDLQDLATSKKVDPRVQDMVLRVLSPLAFDYQRDAELSPITALYNKLKPASWPVNGLPLDPSDPLLTPTADPRNTLSTGRSHRPREPRRMPTASEQMKDLRKEAEQARGNATLLMEAVAFADPKEELSSNEIVQEFHAKCFASQEILVNNLQWATVQAEQSRAAVEQSQPSRTSSGRSDPEAQSHPAPSPPPHPLSDDAFGITAVKHAPRLSSNNPFAPIVSGEQPLPPPSPAPAVETEEEKTLAILLAAHSEVTEALQAFDTHSQTYQEQLELQAVEERSKNETRFDRAKAGAPDEQGNFLDPGVEHDREVTRGEGGSGAASRDPSPARGTRSSGGGMGEVVSFRKPTPVDLPAPASTDPFAERGATLSSSSPPPRPLSPPAAPTDDRRQSRNPYAAFLPTATTSPTRSIPSGSPPPAESGYLIPDSFDAHRPPPPTSSNNRMLYDEPEEDVHLDEVHDSGLHSLPQFGRAGTGSSLGSGSAGRAEDGPGERAGVLRRQGTDESFIPTPTQPSEKALGKLRRMSLREGTESDPVEQQRKLEDALRAKYQQYGEEDEGRRSAELARGQ